MGALQPVAQSGAVALDDEILDRQAGVGKGLPQRLVERAQAIEALQRARVAVQGDVGVIGVEERVATSLSLKRAKASVGQRPDVVVAHRRYMSCPPLTAQTCPVM